ncbi:hypothetical protein [Argonema galeatum]|uniref:hypothetical protein n=1 Tax=Argonema galeatum TaxID=2942762 RepID=UPI0020114BB3|nr:hypothetical protein [Argonema galeatum]MCL1464021.1 hypothetical protein [Argonema galeatum A003/A1]
MSPTPEPTQEPNILGKVASVVGLLGAALFFTGWIYRWSYFYFFQLEITTLDLPPQSFLLVPLQVFFGSFASVDSLWQLGKTVLVAIATLILIQLTLWLLQLFSIWVAKILRWLQFLIALVLTGLIWLIIKIIEYFNKELSKYLNKSKFASATQQPRLSKLIIWLQLLAGFIINKLSAIKFNPLNLRQSFLDEIIIVTGILIALFLLARDQGTIDARRDAGSNSTLPVVTLVAPENRLALGRKFDNASKPPTGKGYHFIGDKGLFNDLAPRLRTNTADSNDPLVWRLLMERGGWIYLFPALPPNANPNDRPPVIAIQESQLGEQLMILSPDVSKKRSP